MPPLKTEGNTQSCKHWPNPPIKSETQLLTCFAIRVPPGTLTQPFAKWFMFLSLRGFSRGNLVGLPCVPSRGLLWSPRISPPCHAVHPELSKTRISQTPLSSRKHTPWRWPWPTWWRDSSQGCDGCWSQGSLFHSWTFTQRLSVP